MDFELDRHLAALRTRVANFIRDEVIPAEPRAGEEPARVIEDLRANARAAGIYGPQLTPE